MNNSVDAEENCAICFESFTNFGDHRLSCLKCGHLFGYLCIKKWLNENDKCPQCNSKAKTNDIRILYARFLRVLDTAERDRALQLAEREKEMRVAMEIKLLGTRLQLEMNQREYQEMRNQILNLKIQISLLTNNENKNYKPSSYFLDQTIELSKDDSCRLLSYNPNLNLLVTSLKNDSPLVPKFGIKKINTLDMKPAEYVGIHSRLIRDMAFKNNDATNSEPFLLSASLDKYVYLTSMQTNTTVQKYFVDQSCWSCCWNVNNQNQFFVGLSNGYLDIFDIRNTSGPIKEILLAPQNISSPITCIRSIPNLSTNALPYGGILVGKLNTAFFLQESMDNTDYIITKLNLEGKIIDLNYETNTNHYLASFGTTTKHKNTRFQMFTLPEPTLPDQQPMTTAGIESNIDLNHINDDNFELSSNLPSPGNQSQDNYTFKNTNNPKIYECDVIHTFKGGSIQTLMTKSHFFVNPEYNADNSSCLLTGFPNAHLNLQICAGDEEHKMVFIWEASTGKLRHKLKTLTNPILDLCSMTHVIPHKLLALSSKHLHVYSWQSS